jgi:hypothetical protein
VLTAAAAFLTGRRTLGRDEWRLLARAGVDLLTADVALRLGGLRRASRWATSRSGRPVDGRSAEDERRLATRYARWIGIAARYHAVRARCLHRSIVLHRWLSREGLPSELRIGVRKDSGRLQAHAWVELHGQAVGEPAQPRAAFVPLPNLDAAVAGDGSRVRWA